MSEIESYPSTNGDRWDFYLDNWGEWRWRRAAGNGKIVGASTQGYKNKEDCINNAQRNGFRF